MVIDPDVTPGGSTCLDPTMFPHGITGYSYQAFPHYPQISRSASSLHYAHILLFLILFSFFTFHLFLLVAPGVSECLQLSEEWSQGRYALLVHYGARQGSSWA